MRRCLDCGLESDDLERFTRDNNAKYGRQNVCKPCSNKRTVAKRGKVKAIIDAFKDRPCTDCGVRYPAHVMDLDHTGEKTGDVSVLRVSRGMETVLTELEKCEVVCANCHRQRTFERGYRR